MTRLTKYLLPTVKEPPADAEAVSHRLLVRAGLVRQVGAGLWTYLPAGWRVHRKVEQIIREEMDADRRAGDADAGAPARPSSGRRRGRYDIDELFKLKDRKGTDYVLGMTHEEVITFHMAARDPLLPRPPDDGCTTSRSRSGTSRGRAPGSCARASSS